MTKWKMLSLLSILMILLSLNVKLGNLSTNPSQKTTLSAIGKNAVPLDIFPTTILTTTTVTTEPPTTVPETIPEPVTSIYRQDTSSRNSVQASGSSDVAGCIRKYESGGTTDTNGSNESGGGYYQIIPSTWDNYDNYSNAEDAPRSVQDEKFNQLWAEGGHQHWAAQSGRCF